MTMAFHIREVESRSTATARATASDGHTSLGRLLGQLADPRSDDRHMDAAIDHVEALREKRAHAGGSDAGREDAAERLPLSLADHRQISNLETVIRAADQAIEEIKASEQTTQRSTAARNLLRALASAAVVQSVDECSSSKQNVCVWTKQSKKRLLLLLWMLRRSHEAARVVLEEVLVSQLKADKGSQMAACLVIFELAQRMRQSRVPCTTDWDVFVDPLQAIVEQASVTTASGPKPSKLGIMALDALLVVLCVAVSTPLSNAEVVQNAMQRALLMTIQWYEHSTKRHWLVPAAKNLNCIVQLHRHDADIQTRREMLSWHWNATALWLCSRSDSVVAAKRQLSAVIDSSINQLHSLATHPDGAPPHHSAAVLRRLCTIISLHTGDHTSLRQLVVGPSNLGCGKLLVSLISTASSCFEAFVCDVLRLILLGFRPRKEPLVHLKPEEADAFLILCVQVASRAKSSSIVPFIAESYLHFGLPFPDVHEFTNAEADVLLRVIDSALDKSKQRLQEKDGFQTHWHRQATHTVLNALRDHTSKHVRAQATSLVPKLDLALSMRYVASELLLDVDTGTSGGLIELLFMAAEDNKLRTSELANSLIDVLCRGAAVELQTIRTPSDLTTSGIEDEKRQSLLLSRSIGGWCKRVNRTARTSILLALTRKVFSSPRDATVLTWLRELSLLGWFDECLREVLGIITDHMTNLERLSEELLEDNSAQSSKAVEILLFARLAPNLVLRIIPRSAFLALRAKTPGALYERWPDMTDVEEFIGSFSTSPHAEPLTALAYLLWRQVLDPLEYKEIKMISVELLTKLPADETLPHVLAHLIAFLINQGSPQSVVESVTSAFSVPLPTTATFITAKLMMYFLNRLFTDNLNSPVLLDSLTLERTTTTLLSVLGLPCSEHESFSAQKSPLVDLQMGAIECLALLVTNSLTKSEKPTNIERMILQVICGEAVKVSHSDVHIKWTGAAESGFDDENAAFSLDQVRLCCCNVLLSALPKLDPAAQQRFASRVLSDQLLTHCTAPRTPAKVQAGCLQVAFAFIYKAGNSLVETDESSRSLAMQCMDHVVRILHDQEGAQDQMLLTALKLLGALIGKLTWIWPSIARDSSMHKSIADGLQKLRDSSSPEVTVATRQLASSLLQAILPL